MDYSSPHTVLYSSGEPSLPGMEDITISLVIAAAAAIIALANLVAYIAKDGGIGAKRRIAMSGAAGNGEPLIEGEGSADREPSLALPWESVAIYSWSAMAAMAYYVVCMLVLNLYSGHEGFEYWPLFAFMLVYLAACVSLAAFVIARIPRKMKALIPAVVGVVAASAYVFVCIYAQNRWKLLGDSELPILVLAPIGGLAVCYGVNWIFRLWSTFQVRKWAKGRGLIDEGAFSNERVSEAYRVYRRERLNAPPVMYSMFSAVAAAVEGESRSRTIFVSLAITALLVCQVYAFQNAYLNIPISLPVTKEAASRYFVNPFGLVVAKTYFSGSVAGMSQRFEYDIKGEVYAERIDEDGRLVGFWNRVLNVDKRKNLFTDYMDIAERSGIEFSGTVDLNCEEVYRFTRRSAGGAKWEWYVVHYDPDHGYRICEEWCFTSGREQRYRYRYEYSDTALEEVERYNEQDELEKHYYPVFDEGGQVDYYRIYGLNGEYVGDTRGS